MPIFEAKKKAYPKSNSDSNLNGDRKISPLARTAPMPRIQQTENLFLYMLVCN